MVSYAVVLSALNTRSFREPESATSRANEGGLSTKAPYVKSGEAIQAVTQAERLRPMGDEITPSWRGQKGTASERGYGWRWQKARGAYLRMHPLCVMCTAEKKVVLATVVDHVTPHRGDQVLFWDVGNWQALCAPHHNSDKQQLEKSGTERTRFDATGRVIW